MHINRLILRSFAVYYIGFVSMRSYCAACYFGLDETNRCHGNECDVPRNMLLFSLLHNSWYLQEQEAILLQGEGSETPYMPFFFLLFFFSRK